MSEVISQLVIILHKREIRLISESEFILKSLNFSKMKYFSQEKKYSCISVIRIAYQHSWADTIRKSI